MSHSRTFSSSSGIAIGPILFVIAMLALLGAVIAAGSGDFSVASQADRYTADIVAQANLIRATLNQCNMQYSLAVSTGSVATASNSWPTSAAGGTAVSALTCTPMGGTAIWGATFLPPPTKGFNPWTYIDASATNGGRCFWTTPTGSNPDKVTAITSGLVRAATKFNSSTSYNAETEVIYDPASASQKFVIWITSPTGSADSHCLP